MNDYQIRERAKADQLAIELAAIAQALTGKWIVDFRTDMDDQHKSPTGLSDDTGRQLWITAIWNHKDRLEVQGCGWPVYLNENGQEVRLSPRDCWRPEAVSPTTTAARSRPAAAIARQIESKILPEYDAIMTRLNEVAADRQKYANNKAFARDQIAKACGNDDRPGQTHFYADCNLSVDFRSDSSVIIDMTAAEAVKVIRSIRKARGRS